ncbi:MAG TPA: hypothetical protein DCS67_12855 [Clostridiales bacterium UBA8960]|nr:hypothetical protein [Clostridiales bacterium UBA8960]
MRILHFEYSEFFRRIVHDMSTRLGFDYIGTSSGEDLFKIMAKNEIDVILSGMELNDMSAEMLIANLKSSKFSDIPIVILTSTEVADIHKRLKGLEFNDFLTKESLTIERLKKCVLRFQKND